QVLKSTMPHIAVFEAGMNERGAGHRVLYALESDSWHEAASGSIKRCEGEVWSPGCQVDGESCDEPRRNFAQREKQTRLHSSQLFLKVFEASIRELRISESGKLVCQRLAFDKPDQHVGEEAIRWIDGGIAKRREERPPCRICRRFLTQRGRGVVIDGSKVIPE